MPTTQLLLQHTATAPATQQLPTFALLHAASLRDKPAATRAALRVAALLTAMLQLMLQHTVTATYFVLLTAHVTTYYSHYRLSSTYYVLLLLLMIYYALPTAYCVLLSIRLAAST